jgi:hypothetical protein
MSAVNSYRRYEGRGVSIFRVTQSRKSDFLNSLTLNMEALFTSQYEVTSRKTGIFVKTTVNISNLVVWRYFFEGSNCWSVHRSVIHPLPKLAKHGTLSRLRLFFKLREACVSTGRRWGRWCNECEMGCICIEMSWMLVKCLLKTHWAINRACITTPWSRGLPQLVRKFAAFCGIINS